MQKRRLETPQTIWVSKVPCEPPRDGSWPPSVARGSAVVGFHARGIREVPLFFKLEGTRWNQFMKLHILHDGYFHLGSSGV